MASESEKVYDYFLENEIKKIIADLKAPNSKNTPDEIDELLFEHFYKSNSVGNKLANEWFNSKGCLGFCVVMPDILAFVNRYWVAEFDEDFIDTLLSPHELIQTYIFCKAREIFNDNI